MVAAYDPLGSQVLSTLCTAVPAVVLLGTLGVLRVRAQVAIVMVGMPVPMAIGTAAVGAANSSRGRMGKMIDAQSIVVASTATRGYGHAGEIVRFVFAPSLVLALLVGLVAFLQAYVAPFTALVVR